MKLKSLIINSYRHIENLDFDFTYPKGHSKAGLPLEKICIVGQSATGKTSILELIKENFVNLKLIEIVNGKSLWRHFEFNFKGYFECFYDNSVIHVEQNRVIVDKEEYSFNGSSGGSIGDLIKNDLRILYFTSEIISKETTNIFNQNPLNIINELSTEKYVEFQKKFSDSNYVYEFLQNIDQEIWFSLLYKILNYRKRFYQMASELLNKGAVGDLNKLNKEYNKWSKENENPIALFAKSFNPILNKLNLEIDLVNTEYSIPIKSKITDEVIPISGLSTGTKGLLLSMFPLFELNTKDAIILLDEPERSLFPDMQLDLVEHYQTIAPEAQFIVATHSPFIAAAFEPEERFILYFAENGKVAVRRGESPIGDDPNDILRNDFNVDYYNIFGKQAYQHYLELKRKVSEERETEKKKQLLVEMVALGDKYNF